jgi:5-methylcytosine-specific restriction protein A
VHRGPSRDRQAARLLATNAEAWRALRLVILAEEPLCRHCLARGVIAASTEVDHIDGRAATAHDYRRENLQGLCERCHSIKTARENGGFGRASAPTSEGVP